MSPSSACWSVTFICSDSARPPFGPPFGRLYDVSTGRQTLPQGGSGNCRAGRWWKGWARRQWALRSRQSNPGLVFRRGRLGASQPSAQKACRRRVQRRRFRRDNASQWPQDHRARRHSIRWAPTVLTEKMKSRGFGEGSTVSVRFWTGLWLRAADTTDTTKDGFQKFPIEQPYG
jgi:hypothetical protein